MKHKPVVMTTEYLTNEILDYYDVDETWTQEWVDRETLDNLYPGQFAVAIFPDLCATTQHLGDATIHGPFETEEEAEAYR